MATQWTQDEIAVVQKHYNPTAHNYKEISEKLGNTRSPTAVEKFIRYSPKWKPLAELGKEYKNLPLEPERAPIESLNLTDTDIDRYIELTAAKSCIEQKASGHKENPVLFIPESEWFAIVFSSDWHIGSFWTQLLTIRREAEIINQTPGMYCIFLGDMTDNAIPSGPHPALINEQNMPPSMQRATGERIARLLASKMKLMIPGCHDIWSRKSDDNEFIQKVAEIARAKYSMGDTKFYLSCDGGVRWCGYISHKPRGHSVYNDLHPCVAVAQRYCQEAEIIAIAHEHILATGVQMVGGTMRFMARTSTRKHFDAYGSSLGTQGKRTEGMDVPVLIMHGSRKQAFWIRGIERSAIFLTAIRERKVECLGNSVR